TDMGIRIHDAKTGLIHYPYLFEDGKRITLDPDPLRDRGYAAHVMRTRETLVINENVAEAERKFKSSPLPGTQREKSLVMVPLIVGDQARGVINLFNMEHEHAFSDSDVRLLQTLANSMSVALENARLFDETQRLFKESEQRAAELAIINSVQGALAAELNIQGIYDAVGEKIREIFPEANVGIRIYEPSTNLIHYTYYVEDGKSIAIPSAPLTDKGFGGHVMRTCQPLVVNEMMAETMELYGSFNLPGTRMSKSVVLVPMVVGGQARGLINLVDNDREHAYTDSDVRL